jgi:hypothetical protein
MVSFTVVSAPLAWSWGRMIDLSIHPGQAIPPKILYVLFPVGISFQVFD